MSSATLTPTVEVEKVIGGRIFSRGMSYLDNVVRWSSVSVHTVGIGLCSIVAARWETRERVPPLTFCCGEWSTFESQPNQHARDWQIAGGELTQIIDILQDASGDALGWLLGNKLSP